MMELNKYLNESQDPKTVEKVLKKINELLTRNENVEYVAVQKKPAVNFSPDSVALTNKRIIFCRPKTFGLSMDFQDFSHGLLGWVDGTALRRNCSDDSY